MVFVERGFTQIGAQVPSGTVEFGENLNEAVIREAREETGLSKLRVIDYLGSCRVDQTKYGLHEMHCRHFFHLVCEENTPETWSHVEAHPSIIEHDTPDEIIFDFSWMKIEDALSNLAEGHSAMLYSLIKTHNNSSDN